MPDFFEPDQPWDVNKFPPKTEEEKQKLQDFFQGPAKPEAAVDGLLRVGMALRSEGAKWVGTYGLCWGMCAA
jgi:hypothetical protein